MVKMCVISVVKMWVASLGKMSVLSVVEMSVLGVEWMHWGETLDNFTPFKSILPNYKGGSLIYLDI